MHRLHKAGFFLTIFLTAFSYSVASASAVELQDQRKMFQSRSSDVDYRIALGSIKKVNAATVIEREISLRANVQSTTFEFDRSVSIKRAWFSVENHLAAEKRLLFSCDGLACGSSNSWANEIFQIKQLYGLDQSQKYRVYALKNQPNTYKIAYFVQRGNKRIYAQIDSVVSLDTDFVIAPSASAIRAQLENVGFYSIPLAPRSKEAADSVSFDDEEFDALVDALRAKPLSKYYLVGHSYLSSELDGNIQQARDYAQTLIDLLKDKRLSETRFNVQSVGSLAPDATLPSERVTFILRE